MLFRVLGPLEVELGDGSTATPGGARARALLATLLLQPDALVPVSRLAESIWGDDPPANVDNAVHVVVGRLRRSLGPAGSRLVTGAGGGYRLDLSGARLDATEFEDARRVARAASSADPAGAVRSFDRALAWWRGPAFGEFADTLARPAAVRLEELRRAAAEERADALLRCGEVDAAVAAAADLVAAYPLAEHPIEVAMSALVAAGRTAEALEAYRQHVRVVRAEGLDPSAPLRELHSRILRSELDRPPRPTVPAGSTRLPRAGSPLFGRAAELTALQAELRRPGLITLVGPGGVGKTRTALELAGRCAGDGRRVWWVDLVPVPPSRVVDAVASAAGVEIPPGADPEDTLCAALAASNGVLVLDNAEHVLDTTAPLAERLCVAAGELVLLATSRERLAVDGERVRRLAPLPLPSGPDRENPAVALFLDRAPGLATGDPDVALVARLCRHLDGLPLAIELGAARAGGLGLEVLVDRLAGSLDLLAGGRRTASRRHRTLRAVIEWSFDLLAPDEAVLFGRLGVFPGTFTLDQVEAVCADAGGEVSRPAVPALLARLVEGSLVQLDPPGRFQLLESLRTFARERLDAAGECAGLRRRHAHDAADRLRDVGPRLWTEREGGAVEELTALTADLHTAWEYAVESDRDLALRLAGDVYDFAYFRQRLDLMRWGLTVASWPCDDPALAAAFGTAAAATWSAGRISDAAVITERGIELAGGPDATAAALPMEISANIAMFRGRTDDAVARYRRGAALRHSRGEPVRALVTELACAHALVNGRRAAEATDIVAAARPRAMRSGNPTVLAWAHYLAGEVDAETDPDRAARAYRTAIDRASGADSRLFWTMAESSAAALASRRGHVAEALAAFPAVLDHWVQLGNTGTLGWTLKQVVVLLANAGADTDAATLAGHVLATAEEALNFAVDDDRVRTAFDGVRSRLGEAATTAALDVGAALTTPAAIVTAQEALTRALDLVQDG
ncbi:MAG: winged helix-turn-helix domain-containing protein [Pseudonocardia sp.]|nr:winged helix-turn-helix domain-containing protein [Pseudonocardia sp.]